MTPGELIDFKIEYTKYQCPWISIVPIPYRVFKDMQKSYLLTAKEITELKVLPLFNSWQPRGFVMTKNIYYRKYPIVDPRKLQHGLLDLDYRGWNVEMKQVASYPYLFASKQIEDYDLFSVSIGMVLHQKI